MRVNSFDNANGSIFLPNLFQMGYATAVSVILFLILENLQFDFFIAMRPYLFTTYMDLWRKMFADPVDWAVVAQEAAYLGIFFTLFTGGAWAVFTRKDVLS